MDSKKTNLTPELKEIYDRVMNTSAAPKAPAAPPPLPTTPAPAVGTPNLTPPPAINPSPTASLPQAPPMPQMPTAPTLGAPIIPPGMSPQPQMPTMPTDLGMPSPAEQALSNTPARPLSEGNTFSFNGVAHAPQPAAARGAAVTSKKKAKLSLPVLIVLGVVFIAVWGVFWAIIFGFIKR